MMKHPKGQFDVARADWRRATVDGAPERKSVEMAFVDDLIGLRESDNPDSPILVFTRGEWDAFVEGAKDGEFDI